MTRLDNYSCCVYKHTNKINNKCYIGMTSQIPIRRWGLEGSNYNKNAYFGRAITKYGWNNFEHEILFENLTKEEAIEKEKELIKYYKSNIAEFGYNLTLGGEGTFGYRLPKETRDKIALILKEKYSGENSPRYGVKFTEEHKRKLSESAKLKTGESNSLYGKHHSEETKQKIREANTGKVFTEEHKTNMSLSKKGISQSEETTKRISEARKKPVAQYSKDNIFIKIYDSALSAEFYTNILAQNIGQCCKNTRKSAGGYIWKYTIFENN